MKYTTNEINNQLLYIAIHRLKFYATIVWKTNYFIIKDSNKFFNKIS